MMCFKSSWLGGLCQALSITAYVALISLIFRFGNQIFGSADSFLSPVAFLLLFVFSAATTGSLALARPVMLYLDKKPRPAIRLFIWTLGWLGIFTVLVFVFLAFK